MSEIVRFNSKTAVFQQGATTKLEVANAQKTFAADVTIPDVANYVVIRVEASASTTASVCARFYTTGGSPSSVNGNPIANLDVLVFTKDQFTNLSFISVDTNTQILWFQWFQV
tara:strand:- start:132 stop:470 length:339 start_codon:yes stop_codon:yes gene_type:complete